MTDRRRPRLLFLSHRLPFPPHNGAAIRTFNVLRILSRAYEIDLLCFDRRDAAVAGTSRAGRVAVLEGVNTTKVCPIPQEWSRGRLLLDHATDSLLRRAYNLSMHRHHGFERSLKNALRTGSYAIVHVDSLDLVRFLGHLPPQRTALVSKRDQLRLEEIVGCFRAAVVPNGMDTAYFSPAFTLGTDFVFLGGLTYWPNMEGLAWYSTYREQQYGVV